MAYTNVLVLPVWSKGRHTSQSILIIDHERAAVIDPGGDLTYVPLTMELNKYTRLKNLDYVMASHQIQTLSPQCPAGWFIPMLKWWPQDYGQGFTSLKFIIYE